MALVSVYGPLASVLAMLGVYISIVGGLFLSYLAQEDQRDTKRIGRDYTWPLGGISAVKTTYVHCWLEQSFGPLAPMRFQSDCRSH